MVKQKDQPTENKPKKEHRPGIQSIFRRGRTIQIQILFLKVLSFCYLAAFVSLYKQIDSMISARGLLPASAAMKTLRSHQINIIYRLFEQLRFLPDNPNLPKNLDTVLYLVCLLCCVLALLSAVFQKFQHWSLYLILWLSYSSFVQLGGPYFYYQWDVLLLEAG